MNTDNIFAALLGIVIVLAVICGIAYIDGLCLEYAIEFWASYAKDRPVDVSLMACILAGLIVPGVPIPAAVITWLLSGVV